MTRRSDSDTLASRFLTEFGYTPQQFSYQGIRFPDGSSLGRHFRDETADLVFPPTLEGMDVLDYGCNIGALCLEAARRGAQRTVGVDINPSLIKIARSLNSFLGYRCVFYDDPDTPEIWDAPFDYVLCLNVLHHLSDPLYTVSRLAEITRSALVLEIAGFQRRDIKKLGPSSLYLWALRRQPILYATPFDGGEKAKHWYMSPAFLINFLFRTRNRFGHPVRIVRTFKGRTLLIFSVIRLEQVTLVGGFTSIGKRNLVRHVADMPSFLPEEIQKRFGLDTGMLWKRVDLLNNWAKTNRIVTRIDIMREYERHGRFSKAAHLRDFGVIARERRSVFLVEPWRCLRARIDVLRERGERKVASKIEDVLARKEEAWTACLEWWRLMEVIGSRENIVVSVELQRVWEPRDMHEFKNVVGGVLGD